MQNKAQFQSPSSYYAFRQGQKLERRTFYGYKRQNKYEHSKDDTTKIIYFTIKPIGIGQISSLRLKLQNIIGSIILDQGCGMKINPCFHFLMAKIFHFTYLNNQKQTDFQKSWNAQMIIEIVKHFQSQEIKKIMENIYNSTTHLEDSYKKFTQKNKSIEKWEQYTKNIGLLMQKAFIQLKMFLYQKYINFLFKERLDEKESQQFSSGLQRLSQIENKMEKWSSQIVNNIKNESWRQKEVGLLQLKMQELIRIKQKYQRRFTKQQLFLLSDQYINQTLSNVNKIQTLRIKKQEAKLRNFAKRYKDFFQTSLISNNKKRDDACYDIKIKRYSYEQQPVLINLFDLVRFRQKEIDYTVQAKVIVKDLYEQLRKFISSTSKQDYKNYYEHLSPSTVIFDQISLRPKISFQPLLLNSLGLTMKPISIQNKITFAPTPKGFDYFRSPKQFQKYTQYRLTNPFYGELDMFDDNKKGENVKNQVSQQRKEIEQLKQSIMAWRFLEVSYFLLNNHEFGFEANLYSNKNKQLRFKRHLQDTESELKKNMFNLSKFLGEDNFSFQNKSFMFSFGEIGDYLCKQNEDSLIVANKNLILKKYFEIRNALIKELIKTLVNDILFGKIINIKKYIFLFFTIAIEILQEQKKVIQAEKFMFRQRRNIRKFLGSDLKRMRNDKDHYAYLQVTYDKIAKYKQRKPQKDSNSKFAFQDEMGKKSIIFVEEIKKVLTQIQQLNQSINNLETIEYFSPQQKTLYTELLQRIQKTIIDYSQKVKSLLKQFIFLQLRLKYRDGPHKYQDKKLKQFYTIYTNKLELLALTYLTLNYDNYILYDSLILPQFRLAQSEKIEIPKNNYLKEFIDNQNSNLKIISELIDSNKLIPKKMEYFGNKSINDELKILQEKQQSSRRKQSFQHRIQKDATIKKQP